MKSAALLVAAVLAASAATAEPILELSRDAEVEMALSAAPETLKAGAGLWVLGADGFEQARASTNGFNCLVSRELGGGAPICYDREGSETTLEADMLRGRLIRQGLDAAAIDARVNQAYAAGELIAPRRPGVAYMLSPHFTRRDPATAAQRCVYPPHVMFYAPNLTNADIGASRTDFGSLDRPWIQGEGPGAYIIMVPAAHRHHPCD